MFNPGFTRSSNQRDHLLQTPDTFVRAPLPGMTNATAIVHAGPALGAAFAQYTVEFGADSSYDAGSDQVFIYVLKGQLRIAAPTGNIRLSSDQYAYLPPDSKARISSAAPAVAIVFEKSFSPLAA